MITLEANKVYKIFHNVYTLGDMKKWRNYILMSPKEDVLFNEDKIDNRTHCGKETTIVESIPCIFVVGFGGYIFNNKDTFHKASTSIFSGCRIGKIHEKDLEDIRRAISSVPHAKYNRKLNKVILNENNTKS